MNVINGLISPANSQYILKGNTSKYDDNLYDIVYCGKLYNKKNLVNEIIKLGMRPLSDDDVDVVLSAFKLWGQQCVCHLNGKFTFAIIDKRDHSIFVTRDRLGKCPLYYYFNDGLLAFASQLQLLMAFPEVKKTLNTQVLGFYFGKGHIPSPYSIYKDVFKLPMGTSLFLKDEKLSLNTYWQPNEIFLSTPTYEGSYSDAILELEKLLLVSVRERLENNKSVGSLLSSGIDSSLIAALLQKEMGGGLNTYTIGINDVKYNEAHLAKQIANKIGTNHYEYYISEKDLLECVQNIASNIDEPFGDSGIIPMMVLSKIVNNEVDIAFGGDGGDEVFLGYSHFELIKKAQKYDRIGGILYSILPKYIREKMPHKVQHVIDNRNPALKSQLLISSEINSLYNIFSFSDILPPYYEREHLMNINDWVLRRQVLDMETAFCDGAIKKSELATRTVLLDLRSPICDHHIVEFSLSLPLEYKLNGLNRKRILRDLAYKYVSKELLDLPKRGFSIPIGKWMDSALKSEIQEMSSPVFLKKQGIFNPSKLNEAIRSNIPCCWRFYIFQKWYLEHEK